MKKSISIVLKGAPRLIRQLWDTARATAALERKVREVAPAGRGLQAGGVR